MKEYHKIKTMFLRDPEKKYKTLLEDSWSKPEFEYLKNSQWLITEKVDGTNIRIGWYPNNEGIEIGGRTSKAQLPTKLYNKLQDIFTVDKLTKVFPNTVVTLYGEGYGAGIRKGGDYISDDVDFILFDVLINDMWLSYNDIVKIASGLGIKVVPWIGQDTLPEIVEFVKKGFKSRLRKTPPEGIVAKPIVDLYNRYGERVITKLKIKDFEK